MCFSGPHVRVLQSSTGSYGGVVGVQQGDLVKKSEGMPVACIYSEGVIFCCEMLSLLYFGVGSAAGLI